MDRIVFRRLSIFAPSRFPASANEVQVPPPPLVSQRKLPWVFKSHTICWTRLSCNNSSGDIRTRPKQRPYLSLPLLIASFFNDGVQREFRDRCRSWYKQPGSAPVVQIFPWCPSSSNSTDPKFSRRKCSLSLLEVDCLICQHVFCGKYQKLRRMKSMYLANVGLRKLRNRFLEQ